MRISDWSSDVCSSDLLRALSYHVIATINWLMRSAVPFRPSRSVIHSIKQQEWDRWGCRERATGWRAISPKAGRKERSWPRAGGALGPEERRVGRECVRRL